MLSVLKGGHDGERIWFGRGVCLKGECVVGLGVDWRIWGGWA